MSCLPLKHLASIATVLHPLETPRLKLVIQEQWSCLIVDSRSVEQQHLHYHHPMLLEIEMTMNHPRSLFCQLE